MSYIFLDLTHIKLDPRLSKILRQEDPAEARLSHLRRQQ